VPLIGTVHARARTTGDVERTIRAKLGTDYVKDPQVTVDVAQNRPFFILGEVRLPGQYPYVPNMSVESAVAIAGGGLSRVKAPRIKAILQRIRDERGSLDLGFLADAPLPQAREWLQSLPGVGPKTAACVLLFSLGRPAFPVDTHVYRVSKRLGLIENGVSPAGAHLGLERIVPEDAFYRFHMNMVAHGRMVCRAQRPRCRECVLKEVCVYAKGKV
jgi:endonuclease-3